MGSIEGREADELRSLLTPLQLQKHVDVRRYLSLEAPNEWLTAAQLDQRLPFGVQVSNFPPEYWSLLGSITNGQKYGHLVRAVPPYAVQYHSIVVTSVPELQQSLPASKGIVVNAACTDHCVGLNTRVMHQSREVQAVVQEAIQKRAVYFIPNQPKVDPSGFSSAPTRSTMTAVHEVDGDEEGSSTDLDGGRSAFAKWQLRAPLGVVRCVHTTRRRVREESHSRMLPASLEKGERLVVFLQRQDHYDAKPINEGEGYTVTPAMVSSSSSHHPRQWPVGTELTCRVMLGGVFVGELGDSCGLRIDRPIVHFTEDGKREEVTIHARESGSYLLGLDLNVTGPRGAPPPTLPRVDSEVVVRMSVSEPFPYDHKMNALTLESKAANRDLSSIIEPIGGVVLYAMDTCCPLPIPRESVLDCFRNTLQHQPTALAGGKVVPVGPWWCDPSPQLQQGILSSTPTSNTLRAFTDSGFIVDAQSDFDATPLFNHPTASSSTGASTQQPSFLLRRSNKEKSMELRSILRKAQQEGARKATEEAATKKRRQTKNRLNKDLCNKHMLNHGINLLKPYRPPKKKGGSRLQ